MCLAIPARVLSVNGSIALVEIRGRRAEADASMVPASPGDYVIVYTGVIVQILDPEEAEERLRLLETAAT